MSDPFAQRTWRRGFDTSLSPPVTDELRLGFEYSILPEWVVGLGLVARETRDRLRDGLSVESTRLVNGAGRESYRGISLTLNKRLSNRWMARGHVTFGDWHETAEMTADPTPTFISSVGDERWQGSADRGSKSEVWMRSSWSLDLIGMLMIAPDRWWGFNIAGHVWGRDGYGLPYRTFVSGFGHLTGDGIDREILVSRQEKLDDLFILDLGFEKEIVLWDFSAIVGIEISNVLDRRTVLQREGQLASSAFLADEGNFTREVVIPRTIRWTLRLSYH